MHVNDTNGIFPWFHGLIDRSEAEELLKPASEGVFLLRISFNCYVLSFRLGDHMRHYRVVNSSRGGYQVRGVDLAFGTLADLINYYHTVAIDNLGGMGQYKPFPFSPLRLILSVSVTLSFLLMR